jgi:hypothetical protein
MLIVKLKTSRQICDAPDFNIVNDYAYLNFIVIALSMLSLMLILKKWYYMLKTICQTRRWAVKPLSDKITLIDPWRIFIFIGVFPMAYGSIIGLYPSTLFSVTHERLTGLG